MEVLKNCTLVLPERLGKGYVIIEEGIITEVGFGECSQEGEDLQGAYLVPGYIDVHVHGGGGAGFELADLDSCQRAADFHLKHGTTTMLMGVEGGLDELGKYLPLKKMPINTAGIFLEGPFISPERPGAIDPNFIKEPDPDKLTDFLTKFGSQIKYIAIAPELNQAEELIKIARKFNVVVSAGHTISSIEKLRQATMWGTSCVCHTFNGMPPMHHREPGVVGGALLYDELYTEIITDGIHIHPEIIRLLFKVKPFDKVLAITDSVSLNGMPSGTYGRRMVNGNKITLIDGKTIAGSAHTMDKAIQNMVKWGIDLVSAIRSATYNPAKALGLNDRGRIATGFRADLLKLNNNLEIETIYIQGQRQTI
jgi:N-acetylglucosamine-6-phosphate deacetylase